MKILTRALAAGAVAAVTIGLAACSGPATPEPSGSTSTGTSAGSQPSGTVTGIFDIQYKKALEPIVADFEAKYPGVKVEINYQGGDVGSVIQTQLQANTAPDVLLAFPGGDVNSNSLNVVPLAAQGRIVELTADWQKDIPDLWKSAVEYQDKLYAFPGAVQPLAAIYNQTLLDEYSLKVPTTMDEVIQLCSDAKAKGVYAYAQGLGDTSAGPQMLSFAQTATLVYGTNPTWDQGLATGANSYVGSGWQQQFELYNQMFKAGCFGEGALGRSRTQGQESVAQRKALGVVDVGAVLAGIKAANAKDSFVITSMPADNTGTTFISSLPIYTLTVNAKAKNADAAKAFVVFAGEQEESAKYAEGFNAVPLIPNPGFTPSAELKGFADLVQANKTAQLASLQPEVQTTLNTGVQSMLLGKETPEGLAKKMQDAYSK